MPLMEENLHTATYRRLLTSQTIRDLLGPGQKVFYRLAPRDTALPYICYTARIEDDNNEFYFLKTGVLTFDIWTYTLDSRLSYQIAGEIMRIFNRQVIPVPNVTALRLYHRNTIEASVENNRSNRRSEDEHLHRREINFIIRGIDEQEVEDYLDRSPT